MPKPIPEITQALSADGNLVLGVEVDDDLEPRSLAGAFPGGHPVYSRVFQPLEIAATSMDHHTAIIAPSGGGKSSLVGRLLEELVTQSPRARCLVLDPNGDNLAISRFRAYSDLPAYQRDPHHKGYVVTEPLEVFQHRWKEKLHADDHGLDIAVRSRLAGSSAGHRNSLEKTAFETDFYTQDLQVSWPEVPVEFLVEGRHPSLRPQLHLCQSFIKAIALLEARRCRSAHQTNDLVKTIRNLTYDNSDRSLPDELLSEYRTASLHRRTLPSNFSTEDESHVWRLVEEQAQSDFFEILKDIATTSLEIVDEDAWHILVSEAQDLANKGIISTTIPPKRDRSTGLGGQRLEVVDLSSLPEGRYRQLVVMALLLAQWRQSQAAWRHYVRTGVDRRIPTYVVVDEAHNLFPAQVNDRLSELLREHFRRIVAEGRKYGLFLVAVSQRPDRLDPHVLGGCANRALLTGFRSRRALDLAADLLSLQEIPQHQLDQLRSRKPYRALFLGPWIGNEISARFLYLAARRTEEGGGNLPESAWTG